MFANSLKAFFDDESGATAIEYGLIVALVSVAAIFTLGQVGTTLDGVFSNVNTQLGGGAGGDAGAGG